MSASWPDGIPKRAIVTGGSTGIGVAILQTLLDDGYEVVNLSRRPAGLEHPRLRSVAVDLTDGEATRAVIHELARTFAVTTIVHNAGVIRQKFLEDVLPEDVQALTQLHLATPISLVQANLATMKAAGYGRIVLVSSRAVLGLAQRTVYSSTKAGMLGLARTWALELGSFGITANVVAPGPIAETEMFDGVTPAGDPRREALARSIPVRRLGHPSDVARAVQFFTDPAASFVTGQTLYVCGGTSTGSLVL
jgi:NAD(P)-dependent dehydrogenase (short-subunit alcohol dehydrogenase family)